MGIRKRFKNNVLLLIICILIFFAIGNAQAAVFNVNNIVDLQNALTAAQNNEENDTINIAAGTYPVTTTLIFGKRSQGGSGKGTEQSAVRLRESSLTVLICKSI